MMRRLFAGLAVAVLVGGLMPSAAAGSDGGDVPAVAFTDVPGSHGGGGFSLTVTYSVDDHPTSFRQVPDEVTAVGGTLVHVRRLVRTGADRNRAWVLSVEPAGAGDVTVEVRGERVTVPHTAGVVTPVHSGSLSFERFVLRMDENTEERFAYTFAHPGSGWVECTTAEEYDSSHNLDASQEVTVSYTDTHIVIDAGIDADGDQETGTYTMTVTCTSANDATVQIEMSASVSLAVTDTVTGDPPLTPNLALGNKGAGLLSDRTVVNPDPSASVSFDAEEVTVAEGSSVQVGASISCPGPGWASSLAESVDGSEDVTASMGIFGDTVEIAAADDIDDVDDTATYTLTVTCTKADEADVTASATLTVTVTDDDPPPIPDLAAEGRSTAIKWVSPKELTSAEHGSAARGGSSGSVEFDGPMPLSNTATMITVDEGGSYPLGYTLSEPAGDGWDCTPAGAFSAGSSADVTAAVDAADAEVDFSAAADSDSDIDRATYTLTVTCTHPSEADDVFSDFVLISVNEAQASAGVLFERSSYTVKEQGPGYFVWVDMTLATRPDSARVTVTAPSSAEFKAAGCGGIKLWTNVPRTVSFTPENWNAPRGFAIYSRDWHRGNPSLADESCTLKLAVAAYDSDGAVDSDGDYSLSPDDYPEMTFSYENTTVSAPRGNGRIVLNRVSINAAEGDSTDGLKIKLASNPTETVTVTVTSSDNGVAGPHATDASTTVTFVPTGHADYASSGWDKFQTVTVHYRDDDDCRDEWITFAVTAAGGNYQGSSRTLWLFVADDETEPPDGEVLVPVRPYLEPGPASPICVSAGNRNDTQDGMSVTWHAPVADASTITHYTVVLWRPLPIGSRMVKTVSADTFSIRVDNLGVTSGREYWFYVWATRSDRKPVYTDVSGRVPVVKAGNYYPGGINRY